MADMEGGSTTGRIVTITGTDITTGPGITTIGILRAGTIGPDTTTFTTHGGIGGGTGKPGFILEEDGS